MVRKMGRSVKMNLTDKIGCFISMLSATIIAVIGYFLSKSILVAIVSFVFGGLFCFGKWMEGLNSTSGYRQEKQNEEILEELRKLNNKE